MIPRSAIGVVHARKRAFAEATSIRAARMGERATVYAQECRHCGHRHRVQTTARSKGGEIQCASCKRRWPRRYVYDSGGSSARPLHSAQSERLERFVDLGTKLCGLTLWEQRVLVAAAETVQEPGRRVDLALRYCREQWPRRRAGWSRQIVRSLLEGARRKVERNVDRRGIFDARGEG